MEKTSWRFKILKLEKNQPDQKSVDGIFPNKMRTIEIKEWNRWNLKKWEEKIKRKGLKYETKKNI